MKKYHVMSLWTSVCLGSCAHRTPGTPCQRLEGLGSRLAVPRPYILILLKYGLVREISMETTRVGVSMEMPSFTMTSFQSAQGQVSSLVGVLEWRH